MKIGTSLATPRISRNSGAGKHLLQALVEPGHRCSSGTPGRAGPSGAEPVPARRGIRRRGGWSRKPSAGRGRPPPPECWAPVRQRRPLRPYRAFRLARFAGSQPAPRSMRRRRIASSAGTKGTRAANSGWSRSTGLIEAAISERRSTGSKLVSFSLSTSRVSSPRSRCV